MSRLNLPLFGDRRKRSVRWRTRARRKRVVGIAGRHCASVYDQERVWELKRCESAG